MRTMPKMISEAGRNREDQLRKRTGTKCREEPAA